MRHLTVRRLGDTGPFHFVSLSSRGGHPTQGCTVTCDHATEDEAWEHHRQWLLDDLDMDGSDPDVALRCEVCATFTTRRVRGQVAWGFTAALCDTHATRQVVEERHFPAGSRFEVWES